MGCYDTVAARCPECGVEVFFQSKGGECLFREFDLSNAPEDVLSNVNRHSPVKCRNGHYCEIAFEEKTIIIPRIKTVSPVQPTTAPACNSEAEQQA